MSELPGEEREARRAINSARWEETSVLSSLRANPIPRQRHDFGVVRGWRVLRRRPWAPYAVPLAGKADKRSRYAHLPARVYTAVKGRRRFNIVVAECGAHFSKAQLKRSIPEDRELCWRCACTVEHRP
jgi:hypothetical protein